ncbi:MAG: sporulation integral membrane protein YtvI [Ruminococcaceae bacterium]|nr:sporulation integral membrane protein YtvI [Oscillospiraceae bacterium]
MQHPFFRKVFLLALCALGLWIGLRFLLPIAMPFLLAALLSLAAEPLVGSLQRRLHLSRGFASAIGITIALLLATLAVIALLAFLIRELGSLADVLPDLESATLSGLDSLEYWLLDIAQKAPGNISPVLTGGVQRMFSNGSALLDRFTSSLVSLASRILKALPSSALGFGTWVLAAFMLSARLPRLRQWLKAHLPDSWQHRYLPYLQTLKHTLLGWLLAQLKLVGVTFAILTAGFLLLRVEHALLWAAAVCLVDILPVLGTGTVLLPWSLVCFLQGDTLRAIGMIAIYATISLTRSVLEPRFVGKQLGLDPLIALLAIYAGYRLGGLMGMLLAPILAVAAVQILQGEKKQL